MRRVANYIAKGIDIINFWTGRIISYGLVVMLFIMIYEVVARYVFNAPTHWAWPINQQVFGIVLMIGGGYVLLERGHVRLDVVYERFSDRGKIIADICTFPVFVAFLTIVAWQGWKMATSSLAMREAMPGLFHAPIYPTKIAFLVAGILLFLQGIANLVHNILELSGDEKTGIEVK